MSTHNLILSANNGRDHHFSHSSDDLLEPSLLKVTIDVLFELLIRPHRFIHELLCIDLSVVFLDRVVSKMCEFVVEFGRIVLFQTETQVEFRVTPNSRRSIVLNEHPLTNIEFALIDDKRILYIFLHDELSLLVKRIIENVSQF